MKSAEIVLLQGKSVHGTVVIDKADAVWITTSAAWWDLASKLWWWFCPSDRKAMLLLTTDSGKRIRVKAIRLSKRYVRLGEVPEPEKST